MLLSQPLFCPVHTTTAYFDRRASELREFTNLSLLQHFVLDKLCKSKLQLLNWFLTTWVKSKTLKTHDHWLHERINHWSTWHLEQEGALKKISTFFLLLVFNDCGTAADNKQKRFLACDVNFEKSFKLPYEAVVVSPFYLCIDFHRSSSSHQPL